MTTKNSPPSARLRIGIVVPHIFMQDSVLPQVIFSPGVLAKQLAEGLQTAGHKVTLFTPGHLTTSVQNYTPDTSLFEQELAARQDTPVSLLKKHPLTFITLARQLQAELIAKAYQMVNDDQLDIVHVYTNEEETGLVFANLCKAPVVFTHHDPFNFLVRYRSIMPKYSQLNWISLSLAQRQTMPATTNWVGNVYHGLDPAAHQTFTPDTAQPYVVFMGRIIESKGLHLAIKAVHDYNQTAVQPVRLKIAGKHYSGEKDRYWQSVIEPLLHKPEIDYLGFINDEKAKNRLLGEAKALLMPSVFAEPFGMVMIESLAAGTPVIGLDRGAISEVVKDGLTGIVVQATTRVVDNEEQLNEEAVIRQFSQAIGTVHSLDRRQCRADFEQRFSLQRMVDEHLSIYHKLVTN